MKKMKFLFLSMMAVATLTTSCKSDDDSDNNNEQNFLIIGDDRTTLENGFLISFGEDGEGVYDWDIVLTSEGISVSSEGDFEGQGSILYLDILTDNMTGLSEGTYSFNTDGAFGINFIEAFADITIDSENEVEEGDLVQVTSGTIDIDGIGNNRVITVAATSPNNLVLSARFDGNLQIIE